MPELKKLKNSYIYFVSEIDSKKPKIESLQLTNEDGKVIFDLEKIIEPHIYRF